MGLTSPTKFEAFVRSGASLFLLPSASFGLSVIGPTLLTVEDARTCRSSPCTSTKTFCEGDQHNCRHQEIK